MPPAAAFYNKELGEFILPYDAVRTADAPDAMLLEFLQSTYEAAPTTPSGTGARSSGRRR